LNEATPAPTSYDEVPYPSLAHAQTHPDSLATLGRLVGLTPAPLEHCRVLEIGCATGANLLPMALSLPNASFVGLDYSARQIEAAQAAAEAVGIDNVRLLHLDIRAVTAELGQFDYIVAHGIYSWVPPDVRDHLLTVCKQNLAPNGVAFVSYNTYPGWHMLGTLRDMMLFHVRELTDPRERAAEARHLLEFMADSVPSDKRARSGLLNAYSAFLKGELTRLGAKAEGFLLHDELETVNDPVYFWQFMQQAERHGLQYVTDYDFRSALPSHYSKPVAETFLRSARNIVEMEQYLDFLLSRSFRQTLLCHPEQTLTRKISSERLQGCYVASRAVPVADQPDLHSRAVEKFRAVDGAMLSIDHPASKAAMLHLAEQWPQAVPFDSLLAAAQERLNGHGGPPVTPQPEDQQVLAVNMLKAFLYSSDLIELHAFPLPFALRPGARPVASPWVRWQAANGSGQVTNLRHERVELDPLNQFLAQHLDGTRDTQELVDVLLAESVAGGKLVVEHENEQVNDPAQVRAVVTAELKANLRWLASAAILVQ
jgi:methyltransferase-like protein/2-polyprenyl-3-methyl-5-hydroxy-6-metoxy-1,4-benzoquinol methylase